VLERGFNQSELIARRVARRIERPFAVLLRRVRRTGPQARLPGEKRAANVRGAFAATGACRRVSGGVLLVDDVLTTGNTLREAAGALRKAGVGDVFGACAARSTVGQDF
jgi:predicted amidophosphoribosyltransferase